MKKSVKLFSTIFMVMAIVCMLSTFCFAGHTVGNVTFAQGNSADTTALANKASNIVATLRNIAAIIAVIIVAILGIKYMLGSVEERAEYKKSFMPLIIGVVVVLLAFQIASMIFALAS